MLIVAVTFYYDGGYAMGMCDIDDAIPFVFFVLPRTREPRKQAEQVRAITQCNDPSNQRLHQHPF